MREKCLVCGETYEHLAPAHLKTHGLTMEQYRELRIKYSQALQDHRRQQSLVPLRNLIMWAFRAYGIELKGVLK